MFGGKNHVGIDREHGFVRRFAITHAAAHDGGQLGALLDPDNTASGVWADTASRSAANLDLLDRRGLKPEFQRAKPRRRPMPRHVARGNAHRARVRAKVEHVFAAQKHRFELVIRTVGLARATAKLALANLAYNFTRLAWIQASCRRMTPQAARRPLIDGRSNTETATPTPTGAPTPLSLPTPRPNPPQNHVLRSCP